MSALGTEFKYGIRVGPVSGLHLQDYDFEVTTYVNPIRSVTFRKSDTEHVKPIDADSYSVIVDKVNAVKVGRGTVLAQVVVHIPDGDFPDGVRTEVYKDLCTGVTIT